MTIAENCIVSMRYTMKNAAGEIVENTFDGTPVSYLHGSGRILRLLQLQLEGLRAGDKKKVYGENIPGLGGDYVFDVLIEQVRSALPEEVLLGYSMQPVPACDKDCYCYNPMS